MTQLSPHKLQCDDNLVYVVKPNVNDRQFANDLICFALAVLLDVPVFDAAIVTVSPAFLASSPGLAGKYQVGIHFGSIYPSSECFDGWNASPALIVNEVANASHFYRLAMFDEVVHNADRGGNPGNVVFVRALPPPRAFEFRAIDHGNAFLGGGWTPKALDDHIPTPLVPVLDAARDLFVSKDQLLRDAAAVAGLAVRFGEMVEQAKSGLSAEERTAVTRFACRRSADLVDWVSGPAYAARLPALA